MKKWLLIIALCTSNAHFPVAVAEDINPVIVQVNEVCYQLDEVQAYLDSYLQEAGVVTAEEAQLTANSVLESFVDRAVLDNKIKALGLDTGSPEEELALVADAANAYKEMVDQYMAELAASYKTTEEAARETAEATLRMQGVTEEAIRKQARIQQQDMRLLAHIAGDIVSVPEGEIDAAYETYYVDPCRQAYAYDIPIFEQYTVLEGDPTYYIPEGYRQIQQIMIPFSEDIENRMVETVRALNAAYENAEKAEQLLEKITAANGDTQQAQEAYDEAVLVFYEKENAYTALKRAGMLAIEPELNDVLAKIEAGESFESLIEQYSAGDAEPFAVHANSILFADEFVDAAMALAAPGDTGEPFATPEGGHILLYMQDVPSGPVPITTAMHDEIAELLVIQARYAVLERLLPEWREEYEVFYDNSLLQVSGY